MLLLRQGATCSYYRVGDAPLADLSLPLQHRAVCAASPDAGACCAISSWPSPL